MPALSPARSTKRLPPRELVAARQRDEDPAEAPPSVKGAASSPEGVPPRRSTRRRQDAGSVERKRADRIEQARRRGEDETPSLGIKASWWPACQSGLALLLATEGCI